MSPCIPIIYNLMAHNKIRFCVPCGLRPMDVWCRHDGGWMMDRWWPDAFSVLHELGRSAFIQTERDWEKKETWLKEQANWETGDVPALMSVVARRSVPAAYPPLPHVRTTQQGIWRGVDRTYSRRVARRSDVFDAWLLRIQISYIYGFCMGRAHGGPWATPTTL